jgi:hypothetical protein
MLRQRHHTIGLFIKQTQKGDNMQSKFYEIRSPAIEGANYITVQITTASKISRSFSLNAKNSFPSYYYTKNLRTER